MGVLWIGLGDAPDEEFTGHTELRDYSGIMVCKDYKPLTAAGDGVDAGVGNLFRESGPTGPKGPLENAGGIYVSTFYFYVYDLIGESTGNGFDFG